MIIATTCPICHRVSHIEVDQFDYFAWRNGAYIQDVMSYLSPNQRELLISGTCEDCWKRAFEDEDEDVDEEIYEDDDIEIGFNPYSGEYDYDC